MHFKMQMLYPSMQKMILLITLVPCLYGEECEMTLNNNRKAPDGTVFYSEIASEEACKVKCLDESSCVAVRYQALCFYVTDSNLIVDQASSGLWEKTCEAAPTDPPTAPPTAPPTVPRSASCTMDQSVNTDAQNPTLELPDVSQTSCQDACQAVSGCKHFVFIQASSACKMYTASSATTSSQVGHATGQRKFCDNGEQCCFDVTSSQTITDTPALTLTSSQASCEEMCLAVSNCQAVVFTGTTCKLFAYDNAATITSTGSTFVAKSCPEGASAGSLTYTDTCESSASKITPLNLSLILALIPVIGAIVFS